MTAGGMLCGVQNSEKHHSYNLAAIIERFFQTGKSPIDPAESLEVIAFMEAVSRSRAIGGASAELADLD